jgi:multidrug transporter EmrE-like cation transporter
MDLTIRQFSLILLTALGALASQLLLKQGVKGSGELSLTSLSQLGALCWQIITTPALLLGYILAGVTAIIWLLVLSRMDLSHATPVLNGVYYILLMLASAFVLREDVTPWRIGGAILIVVGVAVLSRPT